MASTSPTADAADPVGGPAVPQRGVVLIGYRGSGKSSAGAALARKLGRAFIDTDAAVQQRFGGRDAAEIFATPGLGEKAFRDVEAVVVAESVAAAEAGAVVATGGGAVTESPAARAALRNGRVMRLYLHADAGVLAQRIAADGRQKRPGLTAPDADPAAEVAEVLAARDPLYRQVADEVVESGDRSIDEVVEAVIALLEASKPSPKRS